MNCAYGIMITETKIPKDIVLMIMDFIITPNKKGLIDNFDLLNVSNNKPKNFMRVIKYNNKNYYRDIRKQLSNILYYPRLIDNNTKYMSIRQQINDMNINSLRKLRITHFTKKPGFYITYSRKDNSYTPNNDEIEMTNNNDFKKRLNNIDATYKVFVDSVLNTDRTEIMKNNYLRNYNIDAYTQQQFSKVRNEIIHNARINKYLKNIYYELPNGQSFNTEEEYDFYPISFDNQSIYRGTDCVNNFEQFEIVSETNKYYNIEVYYKIDENNRIKITEKVKKDNLWYCLLKNKEIVKHQYPNLLNFHTSLRNIECITLDMNKINKKYNLNIDMKYWKKCYGSKYAHISSYEHIDYLSVMFLAENYKRINPNVFNKFKNKYNL